MDKLRGNHLTEEELLELLNSSEGGSPLTKTESNTSNDDIYKFINNFSLEDGNDRVPLDLLHRLFNSTTKNKLKKDELKLCLIEYFNVHNNMFLLDKSKLNINEQIYKLLDKKPTVFKLKGRTKEFRIFLETNGIVKGDTYLELDLFYLAYSKWRDKTRPNKRVIPYSSFREMCFFYLNRKNLGDGTILVGCGKSIEELIDRNTVVEFREGNFNIEKEDKSTGTNETS
jgi:hypothetical protein